MSFVHLHLHTQYSLLDGAVRSGDLMKKAKACGMPAVAMTDHGNLYGAVEFYKAAEGAGIKPIIGCELYVAPGSMREKGASSAKDAAFHLTVLAENAQGYRNLVKLTSAAHLEGFYYKPRVDKELLAQHAKGIIALSGCLKGEINTHLAAGRRDEARKAAADFRDIFGRENFMIELHDHGMEAQRHCNLGLITIARDLSLDIVAANDVHFLEREHHDAHDVMICIGTGAMVHDEKRMRYLPELYFKTPEEMRDLFAEIPEACDNTLRVAERVDLKLDFGTLKYPAYQAPDGMTREGYLRDLCRRGMVARYGDRAASDPELGARLEKELGVIEKAGYTSYFLIVWDFIHHAKGKGIPVGPGRGSAAGSLVAYVLGITDLCPLRYGLIFERFLNPERVSPPDIDIDFCVNRRAEVIDYVREKYSERAVAQIVTYGTLGAKSVVRDVARVLGYSYGDGDRIAKLIPNELNISLADAAKKNPELAQAIQNEGAVRRLWDYALVLEGLSRNTGIHAAGVVIGDGDLSEHVPLSRGKDNEIVTQFDMNALTDLGMLKMDFLGLKNLTVIADAVELIRKKVPDFSIDTIPLDDSATFGIYNRGETIGVFQVESGGMTKTCKKFQLSRIEDIIALIALYRPGPMDLIDDYIERKKGLKKVKYEHPLLEQVASETYGVLIYQEQVMNAASVLAGYSLGEADLLRRAMGKKDPEKMAKERGRFVKGCAEVNGIDEKKANAIFDLLEKFAGYGFNKSHSAAYGVVSYQTAFLKANHPLEFMAALLSSEYGNTEKISVLVAECGRMGIRILPPDVNRSGLRFEPDESGNEPAIRFGLSAIKNVGEAAMAEAIAERERGGAFASLEDFCRRLDSRTVNRKIMETLVKCGAFDWTGRRRTDLFGTIERALSSAAHAQRDRASGQVSLFGDDGFDDLDAPAVSSGEPQQEWTKQETLAYEKELLGFYVTGHPLDDYLGTIEGGKFASTAEVKEIRDRQTVKLAGIFVSLERRFTRKDGKPMVIALLEDLHGTIELTGWSEVVAKHSALLQPGRAVSITATIFGSEDGVRASIQDVSALKAKPSRKAVTLRLDRAKVGTKELDFLAEAIGRHKGPRPLLLEFVADEGRSFKFEASEGFRIGDERALRAECAELLV